MKKRQEIPFPTAVTVEHWKTIGLISNRMYNWYMDILESELNEF